MATEVGFPVSDPGNALGSGAVQGGILLPFVAAAAITRGSPVCIDSDGEVTDSATATLHRVIGVAYDTIAAGEVGRVQVLGYCDYVTTDEGVADADLRLMAIDGGLASGVTEAEMAETGDATFGFHTFAINLAADTGAVGICFITCGGNCNADTGAN